MVIAARSRSVHGPWENAPDNPLVRTRSAAEKWWSRGHATLVEGPKATWWLIYHGYENGFWTLGRQTLLDPIEWTEDGWFKAVGGDLSRPLHKPVTGQSGAHGLALSDDFSVSKFGIQWGLYDPGADELRRVRIADNTLYLSAKGTEPRDSSPIAFIAGDLAYEVEADLEIDEQSRAGLLLSFEVSGYHHNVAGDFLSLRPAIYAAGSGEVRVRNVRYTALREL
jgi:xylan 1,4-beta-xylosidase